MYIDLACGKCESSLALDTSEEEMETFSLDLIHRFTKAHEACGLITPSINTITVKPSNSEDNL
jgi:hypothetical protein